MDTNMISTPDINDRFPETKIITEFISYGGVSKFSGPVTTVSCFEDNSLVKTALSNSGEGGVLVVSGKKSRKVALLGDNIALMAKRNGWSGIIVDGCVRDVEILTDIDIGVMAIGSCPKKSRKENKGQSNVTILINKVEVRPGNWIYADLNGILVSDEKLNV